MAKQQYIYTDANELILLVKMGSKRESRIFNAPEIQRVSFTRFTEKKLLGLKTVSGRRITIVCKGLGNVSYDEPDNKEFFEEYLTMLRKYCYENRVTFFDFPAE